jgi:cytochrome c oxidase assembly protein subunit 15
MIKRDAISLRTGILLGLTVFFTYLLMVMGTFVTSTGSGLACPDWPLCYGTVVPPRYLSIWFEWSHRLLGGLTGFFVLLSTIYVWKNYKGIPRILTSVVLGLLGLGVVLGGIIVIIEAPLLSNIVHLLVISSHLVIATVILTCLIFTLAYVLKHKAGSESRSSHYKLLFAAVYLQVLLGIIVRYSGATLACPDFPGCSGSLLPAMDNSLAILHFVHRLGALAIFAISASLFYTALKEKSADMWGYGHVFGLVLLQAFFGIMIVRTSMFLPVIILHGATGFMLLGYLAYRSFGSIFSRSELSTAERSV